MAELTGRTAVVTGGGRGIGIAVGEALAREGVNLLLAARTEAEVEAAAARLCETGATAFAAVCDVTDAASVERLRATAVEMLGEVDILVNNAGAASAAAIHKTAIEDWDRLMAVNARGPFLCMRAFLPGMLQRGRGRVVSVASVAGLHGARYIAAYAASKHALIGLTRAAAADVAASGVTVNAVCPGYVDTEMTEQSIARIVERTGRTREQALDAILATTPQRRLVEPSEVANGVVFLCRERSGGINGQALVIDGGGLLA